MISGVRASSIRIEFDLVDDRVIVTALHHLGALVFHVVAQIVEAELVIGAVGHVAGVGRAAFVVGNAVDDDAGGQPEEGIDAAHPFGVALGEVVVDGDDMHALAFERVEVDRQRGDQRLAFAGAHLGDGAAVQNHAADQLHVKRSQAQRPLGGLAHHREGRHQQAVEGRAGGDLLPEFACLGAQLGVRQLADLGLERGDFSGARPQRLDAAIVGRAEDFAGHAAETDHPLVLSIRDMPGWERRTNPPC